MKTLFNLLKPLRLALYQLEVFLWEELREMLKPIPLIIGILLPVSFVTIFGDVNVADLPKPRVGLVTSAEVTVLEPLRETLQTGDLYRIIEGSEPFLRQELERFEIDPRENLSAYLVPSESEVTIYTRDSAEAVGESLNTLVGQLNYQTLRAQDPANSAILETRVEAVEVRDSTYLDFTMPGLIGITLISTCVYATAMSLEGQFKSGIITRIFVTPVPPWIFFFGSILARVLFSMMQVALILLVAKLVYDYTPIDGWVSVRRVFVLTIPASIMLMNIGYCIAGTLQNPTLINNLAQLVVFPQIILCGTFIPVTGFAPLLQDVVKTLPLYQVNEAVREVTINGLDLFSTGVWNHLWVMLAWSLGFTLVTLKFFRIR